MSVGHGVMDQDDTRVGNAGQAPIAPRAARYIKLGRGDQWFDSCRTHNRIEFGHPLISDEVARQGKEAIASAYLKSGRSQGKATDHAREVNDFYQMGPDCLWVTFAEGSMWWAFAKTDVHQLDAETAEHGKRYRELVDPWRNTDLAGKPLDFNSLSTRLTKVAAYRQTLCAFEPLEGLVRRINAIDEPVVAEAKQVQGQLLELTQRLIAQLHWRDFEVLCDLIFARSGWQRVAELGGLQKGTDLVLQQTATGERAFVQVKSGSDQATLSRYVLDFESDPGFDRMFFICHSPKGALTAGPSSKPVHVWSGQATARQAIAAGLLDWLVQKAG